MKKCFILFALSLSVSAPLWAVEDLVLSAQQKQTLGIQTMLLPTRQHGELGGLPALVVVPGNQMFTVSTPLPVMIEQTLAGVGDQVSKGQVLAILQSPAFTEAQRGLLQAAAQFQLAHDNMVRDEKLWQEGIIAESRFRTSQSLSREAQAAFNERKQMLSMAGLSDEALKKLLSDGQLTNRINMLSPISGIILEKTASVGQRLDAAVSLFKVAKLDPLGLEIQAPLASIHGLKIGANVTIPGFDATGKLAAIGRSLSGGNQTILLRVVIDHGAENLRPGQYLEASVETVSHKRTQWSVPNSALARIGNKTVIFVNTATGFHGVEINMLQEGNQNSLVSAALNGSEAVAVQGVSALKAKLMGIGGAE